jgi:hypothetical protein
MNASSASQLFFNYLATRFFSFFFPIYSSFSADILRRQLTDRHSHIQALETQKSSLTASVQAARDKEEQLEQELVLAREELTATSKRAETCEQGILHLSSPQFIMRFLNLIFYLLPNFTTLCTANSYLNFC